MIVEVFDQDILGETMFFEDPKIRFYWENSFGIPMQLQLNSISGRNRQGQFFTLGTNNVDPDDLLILAPTTVGGSVQGEFELNKTNTNGGSGDINIVDFFHKNIFDMDFDIDAMTNPNSVPLPPYKNFIHENSKLTLNYEAILPLHGRSTQYALSDTFGLDFGEDLEDVEEMSLRIYSENKFPAEIALDLLFLDVNGDSLFKLSSAPELIVPSGIPNTDGRVTSPTIARRDLILTKDNIDVFDQVENIVIKGSFSTFQGGSTSVKFYEDNNLIVKLGVRAKFSSKID